jgi:hypothetical protein
MRKETKDALILLAVYALLIVSFVSLFWLCTEAMRVWW